MLLPYASDQLPPGKSVVTISLLILNVLLTLMLQAFAWLHHDSQLAVLSLVGIVPAQLHPYTFLTYMFFHAGAAPLLLNMFYLWVFGAGVEEAVGKIKMLLLYAGAGCAGGMLQWLAAIRLLPAAQAAQPIVGASAACAGLIGIYAARYYRAKLSFVFLPYRPSVVALVSFFLGYEMLMGIWSVLQNQTQDGVAHWAHVGGFVFGLAAAQIMGLIKLGQKAYLQQDAEHALSRANAGAAMRRWESLLKREPDNLLAQEKLADCWLLLGDTEQAAAILYTGICSALQHGKRTNAARIACTLEKRNINLPPLKPAELYLTAGALEEMEEWALAQQIYYNIAHKHSDAPEAEIALLKSASLALRCHQEHEAAEILANFVQRFPASQWAAQAKEMQRTLHTSPPSENNSSG